MNAGIHIIKLIEAMNSQPIAFNKHYVFIGCGINGALLLSQLVYWSSRTKNSDGWVYKTHQEWTQETGLTRREQDTARKTLKDLGFLTEKKQGVPCKLYFKVEHENLYKALLEYAQTLDTSQLHNSAKLDAPKRQTRCTDTPDCMHNSAKLDAQISPSITENTYREYTENTPESVCADAHEESEPKAQAKKSESESENNKFSAKEFLLKNHVSEQTAREYLELRAKKKKSVTANVLKLVIRQAREAKISNELAFQIIVVRGWDSFNANWSWQETANQLETLNLDFEPQPEPSQQNYIAEPMEW